MRSICAIGPQLVTLVGAFLVLFTIILVATVGGQQVSVALAMAIINMVVNVAVTAAYLWERENLVGYLAPGETENELEIET